MFTVFLSGYVIAFVIGVGVGFVFTFVILFGSLEEWGEKEVSQK